MTVCIWCLRENSTKAIEHIIPDALGCPEEFVLTAGVVCEKCNNRLGQVDQAVIADIEISAFQAGVPRKNRKQPGIYSYGNLNGGVFENEKFLVLNMDANPVTTPRGTLVAPFRGRERDVRGDFSTHGTEATLSFSTDIGRSKKFRRGLVKIGFEALAYYLGPSVARQSQFDSVRSFVLHGRGERPLMLTHASDGDYKNQAWPPFKRGVDYAATFRLAMMEILIDLSPDASLFPLFREFAEQNMNSSEYTFLPANA
jgi:hypothetical protein